MTKITYLQLLVNAIDYDSERGYSYGVDIRINIDGTNDLTDHLDLLPFSMQQEEANEVIFERLPKKYQQIIISLEADAENGVFPSGDRYKNYLEEDFIYI